VTRLAALYARARADIAKLDVQGDLAHPVFGEGPARARLMLIGEAPGREEAAAGRPFVGRAGETLTRLLAGVSLAREDVFITNAVKYRPTNGNRNRTPSRAEILAGQELLFAEIALVRPRVIATLGNVPLRALNVRHTVGACHGQLMSMGKYSLFALYHPASVMYNRALGAVLEEDIEALAEAVKNL